MKKYRYKHKKHKYKRTYRVKRKKSIFRSRFFWLSFLFLIILGVAFYFLVFSSFFQVKEIKISGNIKVPIEDIRNIISDKVDKRIVFFNLKNIFLADLKEIDKIILEKFPQIAGVSLDRNFPDVLAAQIEERKPVAVFCFTRPSFAEQNLGGQAEDCFFVDKEGIIFEKISETPSEILRIKKSSLVLGLEPGKEVIGKEFLSQILKINSKLKDKLKIPLQELLIVSERRLDVKTSEGWQIYFNPKEDLDWQLTELDILLKERIPPDKRGKIEYIDLRFEKIYIYPENYRE